ncbi:WbqC family protein [Fulvivirgaceae bacterium BMA10]|uniref:WbqC family protein n=1 Tax=Splendidivirga corallicola TaxID=3051826 RepID=A0ABT8KKW2_9BACT|nr:WbqC family protein [Fulvivirgaceae bacterium BMA10]
MTTVHQLYFLPWMGYFSKLAFSNNFVVLDDVDFRKRHFYDRVKIIDTSGNSRFVSLPTGQNLGIKCNKIFIKDSNLTERRKILRTLKDSYSKALYYDKEWPALSLILEKALMSSNELVKINLGLIIDLLDYLDIDPPNILLSSHLNLTHKNATEMLICILKKLEDNELLLGDGKSTEIHDLEKIESNGIGVYLQEFKTTYPIYEQSRRRQKGFKPFMSVVDCILNVGRGKTREFIHSVHFQPKRYYYNGNKY